MDKKIIEEMAKELCPHYDKGNCYYEFTEVCECCFECEFCWAISQVLNAGYRKIPENAVVLTRGDYEKLLDVRADVILKDIDKVFKEEFEDTKRSMERKIKPIYKAIETRTRKETAEKFAERLKAMEYQSTDWSHGEHPMVVEVDYIDEICEEITEGKV